MKLRLLNVSDFITIKCAPPTFLRRSYSTIVSPAKDKEDFIYLFIYLLVLRHKRSGDNSLQMEVLFNKKKKRNLCVGKIRRMIEKHFNWTLK
jgi:hypothetical protein